MFACGQGKCKSGNMADALEDTSITSSEKTNKLTYKLVRVEGDGSYIPALEDEVTEVEHLLAEPRNEKSFVDGVLCFDSENTEKCLLIEDFDSSIDYGQIIANGGALRSNNTQGGEDTKFEFLDGMLQGVEEGDLHVANHLDSACDDYLLDAEFSEKIPELDYAPCEESDLGNLDLDSHSLDARDREVVEISKSSTTTISVTESASDQNVFMLHKMTIRELQEAFRSTFGRETSVKDKQWLKRRITFGLQNLPELDNISCFLESGISSNENVGNTIFTPGDGSPGRVYHSFMSTSGIKTKPMDQEVKNYRFPDRQTSATSFPEVDHGVSGNLNLGDRGGSLTQKRLRKPTRRYIEESSDLKPRSCSGRLELPITSSRDKLMRTKSQHHRKAFGAVPLVYRHDSFGGSTIQVPFGLHVHKGRPKKNSSILEHDSEDNKYDLGFSPSESLDDMSDDSVTRTRTGKGGTRRKHHRLWTLSEVMKLIDGVSRYGVGRWTEIKRLLFSSSAYRTSVDLKDKWRNLLRASGAQLQSKREVEQVRKHATRPIPLPVLRRVSELAVIYPYPRERKSKLVHAGPVTAAPVASSSPSSDPSVSRSGRVIHRKNLS